MDSALITVLSNAGIAGIVVILIIFGLLVPKPTHDRALRDGERKDEEIGKLREALALERQRSNDATQAATVTNQLIQGLVRLAGEHGEGHPDGSAPGPLPAGRAALDLGPEDVGL